MDFLKFDRIVVLMIEISPSFAISKVMESMGETLVSRDKQRSAGRAMVAQRN
jgi:hypothetical protein